MTKHCAGTTEDLGKEQPKMVVFRRFLKTVNNGADVTFCDVLEK